MTRPAATRNLTVEQRFWYYVRKADGCWLWVGARNKNGYGVFRVAGKNVLAHRFMYELMQGELAGYHVCHSCDNPQCVNPEHMFLGTDADNHTDKAKKLRGGRALTGEQVKEIKQLVSSGIILQDIAEQFGVSRKSVQRIKNGQYWRYA